MESTGRGSDVSYLMVTFDQIYSELGNVYDPSANLYQQQIDAIPTQTAAAVSQADAKKDLAYEQITNSARQRGMGFSGIPLAEQAKYNATEYAPAIANLKSNAEANRVSLLEAMNSLNRDRRTQAQSIYDNNMSRDLAERQFQESIRQFNEQLAAQRAANAAANASTDLSKYLNTAASSSAPQISANDQDIYNKAKLLQGLYSSNIGNFNQTVSQLRKAGDDKSKQIILNAYKLLGMPNANALKVWGLI